MKHTRDTNETKLMICGSKYEYKEWKNRVGCFQKNF